jgi:predicted Zn-ribbon and HTH transcriptional regulator
LSAEIQGDKPYVVDPYSLDVVRVQCRRCGHQWIPRKPERPPVCPKCYSAKWDYPDKKQA